MSFNRKLLLTITAVSVVLVLRLIQAAYEYNNLGGAIYSTLHIAIVAVLVFFSLRRAPINSGVSSRKDRNSNQT